MCLLGGPGRKQEAELVAAQPVDGPACSLLLGAQSRGDRCERLVAPGVTERVVQLLEVVEIAEEHRHVAPALAGLPGTELEPLLEGAAVADAGERVLEREVGHSRVELGPTDGRGDLPGDRLEETDIARAEGGEALTAGRPELTPGRPAEHDRHGHTGVLTDLAQQLGLGLERIRVVERGRVRPPLDEQHPECVVVLERVRLVGRAPFLPCREVTGVHDDPEHASVGLPPGDRERVGADRAACFFGGELDEIVELLDGSDGRGDRDQRVQLALEPASITVALGRRQQFGEIGLDRAGLDGPVGAQAAEKRSDHRGVELRPGAPLELGDGPVDRQRPSVGAVGHEGVERIAREHDARGERDLVAREAVGIAAPVPALVLVPHRFRDVAEARQREQDPLADDRVLAHQGPLGGVERPWLVQDRVRDADLPDIVEQRAGLDLGERLAAQPERTSDGNREVPNGVGVLARVAVTGAESHREGANDGPVGLGCAAALLTDPGERHDECLLPFEEAAGSIERLPAEIVEQAWIGHPPVIGTGGGGD